jgi:hypothetical protein
VGLRRPLRCAVNVSLCGFADGFGLSVSDGGFVAIAHALVKTGRGRCAPHHRAGNHSLPGPHLDLDAKFIGIVWCSTSMASGSSEGTRFRVIRLIDRAMARIDHSCSTGTRNRRRYPWPAPGFVMRCESGHQKFRERIGAANEAGLWFPLAKPQARSRFLIMEPTISYGFGNTNTKRRE